MKKEDIISNLLISIGLSFIFGYASHTWYGGIIVGVSFFACTTIVNIVNNKNKKDDKANNK